MRPGQIRIAREAKGWTQQDLASRLGVSQPLVSLIERGRGGTPELLAKIQKVLAIKAARPDRPLAPEKVWQGPRTSLPAGIGVRSWHRPSTSGDVVWARSLGRHDVAIAAVDVAGHGPALFPRAMYVRGIVDGLLPDLASAPRMDVLGSQLDGLLAQAGIDAAWFVATIRLSPEPVDGHAILYEAIGQGFPQPLLLTGPPFESVAVAARPGVPDTLALASSLRLVLSSDGLLRRLGAGDEAQGRRSLLRWQTGQQRDREPASFIGSADEQGDDESLLVLSAVFWDRVYELDVADATAKHTTKTDFEQRVRSVLGKRAAERALRGLSEALSNVHLHAYGSGPGEVVVRLSLAGTSIRLEVEDRGRGAGAFDDGSGMKLMRHVADHVDVRANQPHGTIVHMVVTARDGEEDRR